jgi:hypothetical protein
MNYIFPELATYDPAWIPLLESARELVRHSAAKYVCNALYAAAQSSNACEKFSAQAEELNAAIKEALGDRGTVMGWFRESHPDVECYSISYRLAWIDHIIARCKE